MTAYKDGINRKPSDDPTAHRDLVVLDPPMEIPYGYCHCGCGEKTSIAAWADPIRGYIKGEPRKWIRFHHGRRGPSDPCRACGEVKPIIRGQGRCRECINDAARERYKQDPTIFLERAKARYWADPERASERGKEWRARQAPIFAALKAHPCVDCGVQYPPPAMVFDHVRGNKKYTIDVECMVRSDLQDELAKCELRCQNCHMIRHHWEGSWPKTT